MREHPVHVHVEVAARIRRLHVVIRVVLLVALGALGYSSVYWVLYLALPALVALSISQKGGARYLTEDGPRIVRVLRWMAGAQAYLWLLSDVLPTADPGLGPVELEVSVGPSPTVGLALSRLFTCLPALVLLTLLSLVGGLVWLAAGIAILARERMPAPLANFLSLTLSYQVRVAAYHLSLVDRYPSFAHLALHVSR